MLDILPVFTLLLTTCILWESARPIRYYFLFLWYKLYLILVLLFSRGKHFIIMKPNVKHQGAYVIFHLKIARRPRRNIQSRTTLFFFLSIACALSGCFLSSTVTDSKIHARWIIDGPMTTDVLDSPGCLWHPWLNPYVHLYNQLSTIGYITYIHSTKNHGYLVQMIMPDVHICMVWGKGVQLVTLGMVQQVTVQSCRGYCDSFND